MTANTPPIRRAVVVSTDPATAFALWREQIGAWWPLARLSVYGEGTSVSFEGDQIVERGPEGSVAVWGTVTASDPGSRITFTWHPGHGPERATTVEVRFTRITTHGPAGAAGGTLVELEHSGWDVLADPTAAAAEYGHGWPGVLDEFASSAVPAQDHAWIVLRHTAAPDAGAVFQHPDFAEHAAFLQRCAADGVLVAAGPLGDGSGAEGMTVLRVPAADAERYTRAATEDDESVRRGLFAVQASPWRVVMSPLVGPRQPTTEEELPLVHHCVLYASDYETSERIFTAAFAEIGVIEGARTETGVEYWRAGADTPSFCVERAPRAEAVSRRVHVAFSAADRDGVDRFFAAAVEAGARAKHEPRFWPEYRAYCAFLRDPDGNNIEVLCKET